jgi:hypothetical protein
MSDQSTVTITINFDDPDLDSEEQDKKVQSLLDQLKNSDEVNKVGRVASPEMPECSKALASGWIVGLLSAEVNIENFKKLILFLGERLSSKAIELEIDVKGNKLKIKAGSKAGLDAAIAASQTFIENLKTENFEN